MSKAQLVITAVVLEGRSKSEVARDYDVSRTWVQQLCQRYDAEGATAFEPRSRRPHHNPQAIDAELEERIVRLRKSLDKQGFDAGAATIASHLARDPQITKVPAVSTIWRILKRRGFVAPQPQKRPRSSWKRFCAELPNQLWQADVSHWRLADHTEVDILDIIDDHSRLAVASIARPTMTGPDVLDTFLAAFPQWGTPAGVLTDNGAIFTAKYRGDGRTALEITLGQLGIKYSHSRPYHPQTCGKVERFHQTLKKWLAKQRRARSVAGLQAQLDCFGHYYNTVRPHRALNRRTPAQAFAARTKATPPRPGITVPAEHRVRRDRVDSGGNVTLRYQSKLRHLGVGRRYAGTRVMLLIADRDVRVINEDGQLLAEFTINPTKDYQPQKRPGQHA
jgi:transposase InsO family protein